MLIAFAPKDVIEPIENYRLHVSKVIDLTVRVGPVLFAENLIRVTFLPSDTRCSVNTAAWWCLGSVLRLR